MQQSKNTLFNILRTEAQKSLITQQLAAAVTKGSKMVSKPCCNSHRNSCRGAILPSFHAEARAIITYFGRSLAFDRKNGWCLLPGHAQESKT